VPLRLLEQNQADKIKAGFDREKAWLSITKKKQCHRARF
jgi:hypothetical protein